MAKGDRSVTAAVSRVNENPHSEWYKGIYFDRWVNGLENKAIPAPLHALPEMVWVDMETTGLDENEDVPLELGIVLTDRVGRVVKDGVAVWRIYNDNFLWKRALDRVRYDSIVGTMHTKSGLFDQLDQELRTAEATQTRYLMMPDNVAIDAANWLTDRCKKVRKWPGNEAKAALSGSSPQFDRKFLNVYLPSLNLWFHYRNGADVSATRNLQRMLAPGHPEPIKLEIHRPIPDILDSIELYRFQIETFLQPGLVARSML